ncbi:MAG: bifunctional 2-polyprenyl-6-hydroxyphenol methylase/3-demethylubiquinol 3-O-methyltransferase UbiG [Alphaproteobacteria bacterium]|nr:bifunctional 2-polyprenyl-6-hydroxyphenol methylase/3-demethylubiquinol 3-O-methyltransferase UbiG [Alphaproteobacteria bacterium]
MPSLSAASAGGQAASVDPGEAERFRRLAGVWWDSSGPFRPLHHLNPLRIAYVRDRLVEHFGREAPLLTPLGGLAVLDIGCGGGLLTEPLTRLGAQVTGIDVTEDNVRAAAGHAAESGLVIDYRLSTAEALAVTGVRYDAVLAMEVVEHVADLGVFTTAAAALLAPGGIMIVATLNRTLKSLLLAKIAAEYVLGWLPPGTHDWARFVKPSELATHLRGAGLRVTRLDGAVYSPLRDDWRLSRDIDVNYFTTLVRAP